MVPVSAMLQSKIAKIDSTLSDVNSELTTAIEFLQDLRQKCATVVLKLNNSPTPSAYLNEFIDVNSFLLKCLSLLSEINCKLELFQILEGNNCHSTKSSTKELENVLSITEKLNKLVLVDSNTTATSPESIIALDKVEVTAEQLLDTKSVLSSVNDLKLTSIQNQKEMKLDDVRNSDAGSPVDILKTIKTDLNSNLLKTESCNIISQEHVGSAEEGCSSVDGDRKSESTNDNFSTASLGRTVSSSQEYLNLNNMNQDSESLASELSFSDSNQVLNRKSCSDNSIATRIVNEMNSTPKSQSTPRKCNNLENSSLGVRETGNSCSKILDNNLVDKESETQCLKSQESERENCAIEIPSLNVNWAVDEEFEVVVEYIKSPSEFYVHIVNSELNLMAELESMLKSIHAENHNSRNGKNDGRKDLLSKEIGTYALYYSNCDETWYRVKVIDWCVNYNDDLVNIFLLDFGESKCVSLRSLKPLPDCLKKYPAFAQRCHLFVKEKSESFVWERESTEKMKDLIENSKTLRMKIVSLEYPITSLSVMLWLSDNDSQSINNLLRESESIERTGHNMEAVENRTDNEALEKWNPMREDFESHQNVYDLDIKDPAASIYGYVGKDYERTCKQYAKTGKCYKGGACRKEHATLNPLGFTTDREEVYVNAFNVLPTPFIRASIKVTVTYLLRINQFYCIEKTRKSDPEEETLSTLINYMNEPESVREMRKLSIPPSKGQIVIAKYWADGKWYRAKVLDSQPEEDCFTVMFVDYGNKEALPLSSIRAIEAKYLHLPFQAIQCLIFGIERNRETPLETSLKYLSGRLSEEEISIRVVSVFPGDDVRLLVNVFDKNGKNIGGDLVAKNHAVLKEEVVVSDDCKELPG